MNTDTKSAHEEFYSAHHSLNGVYAYDPAEDGPEVEIITEILAAHKFFQVGKEKELLKFQAFVNAVARKKYGKRYDRLGKKRKEEVHREVIILHLGDNFKGKAYWILGELYA